MAGTAAPKGRSPPLHGVVSNADAAEASHGVTPGGWDVFGGIGNGSDPLGLASSIAQQMRGSAFAKPVGKFGRDIGRQLERGFRDRREALGGRDGG